MPVSIKKHGRSDTTSLKILGYKNVYELLPHSLRTLIFGKYSPCGDEAQIISHREITGRDLIGFLAKRLTEVLADS